MGGSASRELEAVQSQVRLLTVKLQKASAQLQQRPALTKAAEAAEQRQAQLQAELQAQSQQLASSNAELSELRSVKASLPRIKEEVSAAREELLQVKTSKQEQISELQSALRASKEELEELFGKLKFAEQEGLAMRQKRASNLSDDKRELIVQQQAVAASSALLVAEASAALCGDFGTHPVYGTLLADLGYKRLYRGSPATLWAGTLLWERQRAFRQARASFIATAKARSPVEGWPGSITIVESTEAATGGSGDAGGNSGSSGSTIGVLIDGQHRLGAAHVLSNRGKLEGSLSSILVEVYPPMSGQGIKDLFTEINRAEPVLLIDLPDDGATSSDNAILTEAAEVLAERYPAMFKPSHSCRSPHVNVDVLRAEMHRVGVLSKHAIGTADELIEWLDQTNAELGARPDAAWADGGGRTKSDAALFKALAKAREHGFYLGLGWEWLSK